MRLSKKKINVPQGNEKNTSLDLTNFLMEGWRWGVGGLLLGLVVYVVVCLTIYPRLYEAQALILGAKVLGAELMSPVELIERIKFTTFYAEDQIKACKDERLQPDADHGFFLASNIIPKVVKGTNILQVNYRANSSAAAVLCLEAVIARVAEIQSKDSEPVLRKARGVLELTQAQLAKTEGQLLMKKKMLAAQDGADSKGIELELLLDIAISHENLVSNLRRSVIEQVAALEEPMTRPTKLVEPIYVKKVAVLNKLYLLAIVLILGFILGMLGFYLRRSTTISFSH